MATYREVIEGLRILAKYKERGEDATIGGADHDIIYSTVRYGDVSQADRAALDALGWHLDEHADEKDPPADAEYARFV